jgi:hypothetical protein
MINNVIQESQSTYQEIGRAKNEAIQNINNIIFKEEKYLDIKNHYLEGLKYGMNGSDGSWYSNYYRYTMNNHPLLSLFFADELNPLDKKRRIMVFFSTISLAFYLAALWTIQKEKHYSFSNDLKFAFYSTLIMSPCIYILNYAGSCMYCYKTNTCSNTFHLLGLGFLIFSTLMSASLLYSGIIIFLKPKNHSPNKFMYTFVLTISLDFLSYFYYGIFNWIFYSWEGYYILPQCYESSPKKQSILGHWIFKLILNSTYEDDKKEFQIKYPGYISIDKPPSSNVDIEISS